MSQEEMHSILGYMAAIGDEDQVKMGRDYGGGAQKSNKLRRKMSILVDASQCLQEENGNLKY